MSLEKPKHEPRHYTKAEFMFVSRLDPTQTRDWLNKEGIELNTGDVEIYIDEEKYSMSTAENDFGTITKAPENA